ncbi:MAG: hypothetical protein LAT75_05860 [Candidatus Cyclonatronum sp.]|uniref:hypothetical protein n=1 Tax=Cyclonatronum sp. TaxID=3024185 RepID=UPI0025BFB9C5|nr:hypothetical protein [Cyclonatronum sp.]MCC5935183.1 hypothetical protein [Balneolales bacterium]MCH8486371.1 hypothetical protein [Cyclonatronum sp.]
MFKLPDSLPTTRDSAQEWADYAEYLAILYGRVSMYDLFRRPSIISDEVNVKGIEDESDKFNLISDTIIQEIDFRLKASDRKYPFQLESNGQVVSYNSTNTQNSLIYTYLLFCTRNNMSQNRRFAGIDGALVFEQLCGIVAQNYFGHPAEYEVMGTGRTSSESFREQLSQIVKKIGEGGVIKQNPGFRPQDDKVDVIAWKHFADRQPSKLIAFGQCKTGTSWVDSLTQLQTDIFCNKWFTDQPVVGVIRMFFTAQFFPRDLFQIRAYEAGLVFDRFRIMNYLPDQLPIALIDEIEAWVNGLKESLR